MEEYTVDLSQAKSWSDFVAAFNAGLIHLIGGEWKGNLDAFNDYLWWPDKHPYRLDLRGWAACASAIGQERAPDGRPLMEVIAEIFRENPQVLVRLI